MSGGTKAAARKVGGVQVKRCKVHFSVLLPYAVVSGAVIVGVGASHPTWNMLLMGALINVVFLVGWVATISWLMGVQGRRP